ncbi:zinc finger and BTB domain-containing protein 17-like isoform X5 [Macrobrachium nipponense]|uniref:zinc finger and BTB domain-containing protein 17-like isoform X5 n=1 Tax=Macrobrachium nipponense TaxID=159736 RepID=UPI0030C8A056
MEGGLLSLRWNDHSHTFFDMLSTIRRKESYCDVTLVSDGRFYPVHKLVLSTCSDFFDNLFSRTDCKHPVVIVANVSHKDLEALLNYMYLGEVNVLQTELGNLMKAAEVLKIKGLAEPTKSTTKDKDRHHKSFSESFDSSTKRKRVEDSSGPSSKRSQCTGKPDSTESARSRVSSDLQTLSKDSDHGAILPIPSSSNTDPKECLTRTVYDQKGSREDDSSEKAIRPEVKVEEIMVKDEPGSWFNENDESGTNVSYSETDSNIEYSNQTVDYSNSCVPWELPTAAQPHLMESHLPQGMPGASGMQAELEHGREAGIPNSIRSLRHPDPPFRLRSDLNHSLEAMPKRKRCRVCIINGSRRDTKYQCITCVIPLCTACSDVYHREPQYWKKR